MSCKRGDIALLPFPFSDLSSAKRRPVLLLTDPDAQGDFLAAAVTSRPHHAHALPLGVVMGTRPLPAPSWVRRDRVMTLHIGLVLSVFGAVPEEFLRRVVAVVCERAGYAP